MIVKDCMGVWIDSKEHQKIKGVRSAYQLHNMYYFARGRGDKDSMLRFKMIGKRLFFLYENYEEEMAKRELEALYFQVIERFENNESAMAKYFGDEIGTKKTVLIAYFRAFKFTMYNRNLALNKAFKKFLKKDK